jgi:tetratricopeptide (TPR) repeat protein
VLAHARGLPQQANQRVALMGWSCGGLASVTVASRNSSVAAVVGLDASVRYLYSNRPLRAMFAPAWPYSTPTLFLNQGNSLMRDLATFGADTTFAFFDSLRYADAYVVTFNNLRHQNFASMYVRLAGPQPFAFVSDPAVASAGYMTVAKYAVTFLDAYLKGNSAAQEMLAKRPQELGVPDTNLTIEHKRARRPLPTVAGFRAALGDLGWDRATDVLARVRTSDPEYTIDRDSLDNAGVRFLDDDKTAEGLGVYQVYSRLHPTDPRAWNGLGDAYAQRTDTANAIASFQEALKLQPDNGRAAAALKRLGK